MACVFVTMLILLADIWGSILVMICVTMTLVNVMGYMHFWGQTIDVVSSVIIIISIGLCVDYSAHIAHAFLSAKGKKKVYSTDQASLIRNFDCGHSTAWNISNFPTIQILPEINFSWLQ